MMNMFGYDKIARLKSDARRYYADYWAELDSMDCGRAMGEMMNSRMREAKLAFNKTMDELAKIDPNCPTRRL